MARLHLLGWIVGEAHAATTPALAPFVRQKTVRLTSYRRNGAPIATPASIAVDGDRAFVRSFEKAGKRRRIARTPTVEIAPSTALGKPTAPPIRASLRRLHGEEARYGARLLRNKRPLLQGILAPFFHRAFHFKTGRTVHFELTPLDVPGKAADPSDPIS